ncbi:MAG TPA: VWA domain-containing protein [Candidatus Ozemobacteraceae bacterium]
MIPSQQRPYTRSLFYSIRYYNQWVFQRYLAALLSLALLIAVGNRTACAEDEEGPSSAPLKRLSTGEAQPFTVGASGRLALEFIHDGNRYLGLRFSVPASAVLELEAAATKEGNGSSVSIRQNGTLEGTAGPSTLFDALPQIAGPQRVVLTNNATETVGGTVGIVDLGPLPNADFTGRSGTLIVRKAARTGLLPEIDHAPDGLVELEHPEFRSDAPRYDVTPEGDLVFTLPAGLWKLRADASEAGVNMATRFVPVTEGKTTVVENWPILENVEATGTAGVSGLKIRSVATAGADVAVRFSTPGWNGTIAPADLSVTEGGSPGTVTDVRSVATPLRLVLLLDSSGSMKGDMKQVLAAAAAFLGKLPESSRIELIDFDTKPKPVTAKGRTALLEALRKIKADGATALNDTVLLGLERAAGHDRRAIVLLTDGFDANHNDTGPGSKATPAEMFDAVRAAGVPVFTIGYGKKPDVATLRRLAELSGGSFHRAQADTVGSVFGQLEAILGREFEMTYRRPAVTAPSDVPVVCIVQDVSGSMNMPPSPEGDTGYRMEEAKEILRSFVRSLPAGAVAQVMSYSMYTDINQVWTDNREALLRGISDMKAYGGTDTLGALDAAFRSLKAVPSSRRYLLLVTDADLPSVTADEDAQAILGKFRDAGIDCTFVGMVRNDQRGCFDEAASFTRGFAAVSEDPTAMRDAAERLGKRIVAAAGGDARLEVRLVMTKKGPDGAMTQMGDADLFRLPPSPQTASASVSGVRYRIEGGSALPAAVRAGASAASAAASGSGTVSSTPSDGWQVERRIGLDVTASNAAMKLTATELLFLRSIQGIPCPDQERLVAVGLKLENILPEQDVIVPEGSDAHPAGIVGGPKAARTTRGTPTFVIDNLRQHLFLSWNGGTDAQITDFSWLAAEPLLTPDREEIALRPGEPVQGYIVFRVPAESMDAAVLRFFDDSNGNLTLPLAGEIQPPMNVATATPVSGSGSGRLYDGVEMRVVAIEDRTEPQLETAEPPQILRVLTVELTSQVAALFRLDPFSTFTWLGHTPAGPVAVHVSPYTTRIAGGWRASMYLTPGGTNRVRLAFAIPRTLAAATHGTLSVRAGDAAFDLALGDTGAPAAQKPLGIGTGDGVAVRVNGIWKTEEGVFADVTFADVKDGADTSFEHGLAVRANNGVVPAAGDLAETHLFGFGPTVVVPDGQERRGLIGLDPASEQGHLVSAPFGLDLPVRFAPLPKELSWLIATRQTGGDDEATPELDERIRSKALELQAKRAKAGWTKPGQGKGAIVGPKAASGVSPATTATSDGDRSALPAAGAFHTPLTHAGAERWKALLGLDEVKFLEELGRLVCMPSAAPAAGALFGPEAVLTQGWGTPADLCAMTCDWAKARGLTATTGSVPLTDAGRADLASATGFGGRLKRLPVLRLGNRLLAFPFGGGDSRFLDPAGFEPSGSFTDTLVKLTVRAFTQPAGGTQAAQMGGLTDALGGGSSGERQEVTLLDLEIPSRKLSADIAELAFPTRGDGSLKAALWLPDGTMLSGTDDQAVDTRETRITGCEITIQQGDDTSLPPLGIAFENGREAANTVFALGVMAPDLPAPAASSLEIAWKAASTVASSTAWSRTRELLHSRLATLIALQTRHERELAAKAGVRIARPDNPRIVILSAFSTPRGLETTVDLRQARAQAVGDPKAVAAFQFGTGIFDAVLEERICGGEGLISRWGKQPGVNLIPPGKAEALAELLAANGTPERVVQLVRASRGVLLFPKLPKMEGATPRWSWFEIDPETFAMTSVLDDGSHGAAEDAILEHAQNANSWTVGFLIGVDVALGSTAAFSLTGEEYATVMKMAAAFAASLEDQLTRIGPNPGFSYGGVTVSLEGVSFDPTDPNGTHGAFGNFTDGYEKGVAFYFLLAKPPTPSNNGKPAAQR